MEWGEVLFGFDGRINRSTFWLKGVLPVMAITIVVAAALVAVTFLLLPEGAGFLAILGFVVLWLPLVWAQFAVATKRFHDIGASGWWCLALLVPYLGIGVILVLGLWPGSRGDNEYGPPQGSEDPWARSAPSHYPVGE